MSKHPLKPGRLTRHVEAMGYAWAMFRHAQDHLLYFANNPDLSTEAIYSHQQNIHTKQGSTIMNRNREFLRRTEVVYYLWGVISGVEFTTASQIVTTQTIEQLMARNQPVVFDTANGPTYAYAALDPIKSVERQHQGINIYEDIGSHALYVGGFDDPRQLKPARYSGIAFSNAQVYDTLHNVVDFTSRFDGMPSRQRSAIREQAIVSQIEVNRELDAGDERVSRYAYPDGRLLLKAYEASEEQPAAEPDLLNSLSYLRSCLSTKRYN